MTAKTIPFHRTSHGDADVAAVRAVLESGHTGGGGTVGQRVERELSRILGSTQALLTTSCTHAMEACLMALGIGAGHEVIVPGFLYVSLAAAVARQGARPVFVDIEPTRLGLDPARVAAAITPRTRAIFAVHYGGMPCRIEELVALGAVRGIPVLEDAAQGFGSLSSSGRPVGTLGLAGCMSFHESKNVSCGEGGALFTDDATLASAVETIRDKGTNRAAAVRGETPHYTWVSPGSSFTLAEVLAAVLEVQLAARDAIARERARVAARYQALLEPLAERHGLTLAPHPTAGERFNHHIVHVLVPRGVDRDDVSRGMRARGIQVAAHFQTLHDSPFMRATWPSAPAELPVTADTCARILRLPIFPALADADVAWIVDALDAELARARSAR